MLTQKNISFMQPTPVNNLDHGFIGYNQVEAWADAKETPLGSS
jgi:hypothetical protein